VPESMRHMLKGVQAVNVGVLCNSPLAPLVGLVASVLQTEVELRLRKAALPVVDLDAARALNHPHLMLEVLLCEAGNSGICSASASLVLLDYVYFARQGNQFGLASTWNTRCCLSDSAVGIAAYVRDAVGMMTDEFLNDFLAAQCDNALESSLRSRSSSF
jgi:hypothetical protein